MTGTGRRSLRRTAAGAAAASNRAASGLLADAEASGSPRAPGVEPLGGPPERLEAMTRDEVAKWRGVVRAARIRGD